MAALTLLFLTAYLIAVAAFGFAWRRRAGESPEAYFVADRSFGTFWGFVGLASLTTGGSTTIALASLVYVHGLSGLWLDLKYRYTKWRFNRQRRRFNVHSGGRSAPPGGWTH